MPALVMMFCKSKVWCKCAPQQKKWRNQWVWNWENSIGHPELDHFVWFRWRAPVFEVQSTKDHLEKKVLCFPVTVTIKHMFPQFHVYSSRLCDNLNKTVHQIAQRIISPFQRIQITSETDSQSLPVASRLVTGLAVEWAVLRADVGSVGGRGEADDWDELVGFWKKIGRIRRVEKYSRQKENPEHAPCPVTSLLATRVAVMEQVESLTEVSGVGK